MKKAQLSALLFVCTIIAFGQKKKAAVKGKALYFGVAYSCRVIAAVEIQFLRRHKKYPAIRIL